MKHLWMSVTFALLVSPYAHAADDGNQKILKDALVGALTGAVSSEAAKSDAPADSTATVSPAQASSAAADESRGHSRKHKKHKHHGDDDKDHEKRNWRPRGWDKGKKTGWGERDVPPGLAKKSD